jgi:hypothetical protein
VTDPTSAQTLIDYNTKIRLVMKAAAVQKRRDELDHKIHDGDADAYEICEAIILKFGHDGGTVHQAFGSLRRQVGTLTSDWVDAFESTVARLVPHAAA